MESICVNIDDLLKVLHFSWSPIHQNRKVIYILKEAFTST